MSLLIVKRRLTEYGIKKSPLVYYEAYNIKANLIQVLKASTTRPLVQSSLMAT